MARAIEDNVRGFDAASAWRGTGLSNMTDRLDALGAVLTVSSEPGRGTVVSSAIPLSAPVAVAV